MIRFSPSLAIGLSLMLFGISHPVLAQEEPALSEEVKDEAQALMETGLESDLGYEILESLTTEVGPRLGGSPQEARARDWAFDKFRELGFKYVRVEEFTVPYWSRNFESAEIVSPFPQPLTITALGGSVGTPEEGVKGEIVRFETLNDLINAPMDGLEGKIVFVDEYMTRTQDGSGYGYAVRKRSGAANEAGKRGAIAALIRSVGTQSHRLAHTGQMRYADDVPQVPIAALSPPDADQITRAMKRGPVEVWLAMDTQVEVDAPSGNVIAEIPGKTDEIVVIGAHLDSWDLGTGAVDDGAGVGITMAAAKHILDMRQRPERTIRIVLFGAEEIGLLGAYAYAEQHKSELGKHFVGSESDFGAGQIYQFQTRFAEDKLPLGREMADLLAPLGIAPGPNIASGGPDMSPLRRAGVPVVTLKQNGWDYFDLHHTPDDTFDKVAPEDMAQNVAAWAAFTWMAANIDGHFRADEPEVTEASQ